MKNKSKARVARENDKISRSSLEFIPGAFQLFPVSCCYCELSSKRARAVDRRGNKQGKIIDKMIRSMKT